MRRKLTPEQKKQYVLKQTLTEAEIEHHENNPNAKRISRAELDAIIAASRKQTHQSA